VPEIADFEWRRHGRAVVEFQREVYETNFPGFVATPQFLRDYSQQLRTALDSPAEGMFVLQDGRETVGFLWLSLISTMIDPCIGYIKNIYVVPELRGEGYGKLLLQFAEDWCASQGVSRVSLDASCCNERAIGLYEKWGFKTSRVRMEKAIEPRTPVDGSEESGFAEEVRRRLSARLD